MICIICGEGVDLLYDNPPEAFTCAKCVNYRYQSDLARARSNRIHYNKELVTIGKADFECTGYYEDQRLWDEEITINGADVYGLISDYVQAQIYEEICRRVVSSEIIVRLQKIEEQLPDSKNPAALRLKRSDWEGELEKIEEAANERA